MVRIINFYRKLTKMPVDSFPTYTKAALVYIIQGATGAAQAQVFINDLRLDPPSTDNDEFVELSGAPSASLDGLTYLVIGDGTGGSGVGTTDYNATVHVHRGILGDDDSTGGISDLNRAEHRWQNPVARVVVYTGT